MGYPVQFAANQHRCFHTLRSDFLPTVHCAVAREEMMPDLRKILTFAALIVSGPALADSNGSQNWNGLYAGLGIGGRWVNADWDTKLIGNPLCCADGITDQQSFDASGFRFNGFIGYSRVMSGQIVVALEADLGIAVGSDESKGFIPGTVFGPAPGNPGDGSSVDT
ncbi:MAG: hypothetical protein ABL908_03360, partial [Hyphomicrobium sp.]